MPKLLEDVKTIEKTFGFLNVEHTNKDEYLKLKGKGEIDISSLLEIDFQNKYRILKVNENDDGFKILLVEETSDLIVYYIDVIKVSDWLFEGKAVTQVLLWRTTDYKHIEATQGVANKVFEKLLIPEYKIVISDDSQTINGKDFWKRQLTRAIQLGLFVYRYDRLNTLATQITDPKKILDESADLWGTGEEYVNILGMISVDKI
jgi:hypothetical protein